LIQKCKKILILFLLFSFFFNTITTQVQHEFSLRRHKNEREKGKIRGKKVEKEEGK